MKTILLTLSILLTFHSQAQVSGGGGDRKECDYLEELSAIGEENQNLRPLISRYQDWIVSSKKIFAKELPGTFYKNTEYGDIFLKHSLSIEPSRSVVYSASSKSFILYAKLHSKATCHENAMELLRSAYYSDLVN